MIYVNSHLPKKTWLNHSIKSVVIEMALIAYNKMGAEGQTFHSENGVNRSYEKAMYPESIMKLIIPRMRNQ